MVQLNPDLFKFVELYELSRRHGALPVGWKEGKPVKESILNRVLKRVEKAGSELCGLSTKLSSSPRSKLIEHSARPRFSWTSERAVTESNRTTPLLTVTIPDPSRSKWWEQERSTFSFDGIQVIIFESDGYTLFRDPEHSKLPKAPIYPSSIRTLPPIPAVPTLPLKKKGIRPIPDSQAEYIAPLDLNEGRRDSHLAPGNGEGAWWRSPTASGGTEQPTSIMCGRQIGAL